MNTDLKKCLVSCAIWIVIGTLLAVYVESRKSLAQPLYLTEIPAHQKRFIGSELSVFQVLKKNARDRTEFASWFNSLEDEQKRGFILFVRSAALSSLLGSKVSFTEEHWLSGRSKETAALTRKLLEKSNITEITQEYQRLCTNADKKKEIFLRNNKWLDSYLSKNYPDFENGLFYFFLEHTFDNNEIRGKSYQFSALEDVMMSVSDAIIANRGKNTRISPKEEVSDAQVREIVAASFFAELFYGIPADFMLLISAYETNFAMKYWYGGVGTTQQTMRAANTVLQSKYWINKVSKSSGVKLRYQLVSMSALDNVFLCMIEAAKTIAIKAAELRIKTHEISPSKRVRFAGKRFPATWATAYKYNGSRKYAKRYAGSVHYYYKKRKWWLKSFADI